MKRMYIQPNTETNLVNTHEMMQDLHVSSGGTEGIGGGPVVGNAPKKRTGVF